MVLFLIFAAVSLLCFFPLSLSLFHLGITASLLISFLGFLLLHVLYILFFALVSLPISREKPIKKQNALCRFATGITPSLLNFYGGVRPVVTGKELLPKDGRFLFVCNHCSMFDPLITLDKLRDYDIAFISKPENMNIPVAGRVLYGAGFLSIDRENDRNALRTILTAAEYMKQDICNIGVYPEGTRSKTGELLPFHAGCLKAAQRAKVPIVVACVHGTEKVQRMSPFSSTKVYLDILDVIPAEYVCAHRTEELSDIIRGTIQADLNRTEKQEG